MINICKKAVALMILLALSLSLFSCEAVNEIISELTGGEETQDAKKPDANDNTPEDKLPEDDNQSENNNTNDTTTDKKPEDDKVDDMENEITKWLALDREREYYDVLEGKTINFIGDSLFAGHSLGKDYTGPLLLLEKYSMEGVNQGLSGCTLSACEGGANPIVSRFDKLPDNNPDIVIFEGGRNDYNKDAAIGNWRYKDADTYQGAIAILVAGLREKYPNALIIGVTFWKANDRLNSGGKTCGEYTEAMKEACAALKVPYIDASDEDACGIKMTDADFRSQYSLNPSDVCHLNFDGMKIALAFFEREIYRIYTTKK